MNLDVCRDMPRGGFFSTEAEQGYGSKGLSLFKLLNCLVAMGAFIRDSCHREICPFTPTQYVLR